MVCSSSPGPTEGATGARGQTCDERVGGAVTVSMAETGRGRGGDIVICFFGHHFNII